VPIVLKSVSLNLLEPSGPVQACHGIAVPLSLSFYHSNAEFHFIDFVSKVHVETRVFISFLIYKVML
jgi:hypothetical protein